MEVIVALPENLGDIKTNLAFERLEEVARAIDSGLATHVPGSTSMFAGSAGCQFDYQGTRYQYDEYFELCTGLFEVTPEYLAAQEALLNAAKGRITARRESGRGCD